MMMMIVLNCHAREGGKETGNVQRKSGGISGEEEGNSDFGGIVQPSQQHVAPCVKRVECGLGTRGLRMLAAFVASR